MESIGKYRRLKRIFSHPSGRVVVVPLDDSLLAGPTNGLEDLVQKAELVAEAKPNAVIGFPGLARHCWKTLSPTPFILNISASTTRTTHTRKTLVGSVDQAIRMGADAVAVHVNISSRYETEMLHSLGVVSRECDLMGLPLMAIMYPRSEAVDGADDNYSTLKEHSRDEYASLVAHCA